MCERLTYVWAVCVLMCEYFFSGSANTQQDASVSFKALLHPRMKMLSLITYPHVVPNPSSEHNLRFANCVRCSVSVAPHRYVFYVCLRFDLNESSVSLWCG